MRTNIEIDDELMTQAMAATGATTKKAAVEASLRQMVQLKNQEALRGLFGLAVWRGHDDDWFASDEEIRAKHRQAQLAESPTEYDLPAAKDEPASSQELR